MAVRTSEVLLRKSEAYYIVTVSDRQLTYNLQLRIKSQKALTTKNITIQPLTDKIRPGSMKSLPRCKPHSIEKWRSFFHIWMPYTSTRLYCHSQNRTSTSVKHKFKFQWGFEQDFISKMLVRKFVWCDRAGIKDVAGSVTLMRKWSSKDQER